MAKAEREKRRKIRLIQVSFDIKYISEINIDCEYVSLKVYC